MITLQELVTRLSNFWRSKGATLHFGYDVEVGAATFNPATFLRCLGPEPYSAAYTEPCRRPSDGRYGENPNRFQLFHQFQVIFKPIPDNFQQLYKESLTAIGINLKEHDLRFIHDDWENPTIGAHGLGWEVWLDGMEVTQYTYFQGIGGIDLPCPTAELAYGVERLAMYLQNVHNGFDVMWDENLTLGDISKQQEVEWSHYNFEQANTAMWARHFDDFEAESTRLMEKNLPLPAFDFVMKASHAFNLLLARGAISVTERVGYISRIRQLAKRIAESYLASRQAAGFPLLAKLPAEKPAVATKKTFLLEDGSDDFILEIGSEELPASFVAIGLTNLEKAVTALLKENGLTYSALERFGAPRRLALLIKALPKTIPEKRVQKRGPLIDMAFDPKTGELTAAGSGFFASAGIAPATLEQVESGAIAGVTVQTSGDKRHILADLVTPPKSTAQLFSEKLPHLILSIDFPKKMHWTVPEITYARPLRHLLCMHGSTTIPFAIGSLESGNFTFGHSQLAPSKITIPHASQYESLLEAAQVIPNIEKRKNLILQSLSQIEKSRNVKAVQVNYLLNQLLFMSENPQLMVGSFDKGFLSAPKEVLISEMVGHQKYFPLENSDGTLANSFVITADNTPCETIAKGNEKVLSARLSDGVFLYRQDLKNPLESFNEKLKVMTFQKELGTVYDKVLRLQSHAKLLGEHLGLSKEKTLARAALLCKADLASALVGEFPELQGIAGSYYAKDEDSEVAKAIQEHWLPINDPNSLPETETGIILALADKLDNLLGYFAAGLKPTASSDPYALRRAAIGVLRILLAKKIEANLEEMLMICASNFEEPAISEEVVAEVVEFMISRSRPLFEEIGFAKETIESVLVTDGAEPLNCQQKLSTLTAFKKERPGIFEELLEVYKRASGQLSTPPTGLFNAQLLTESAEQALYQALQKMEILWGDALENRDYEQQLLLLAGLQPYMAKLFDEVMIQVDDTTIRNNRVHLLQLVTHHFDTFCAFNLIR